MINRWFQSKEEEMPRLEVPPLPTIASVPHPTPPGGDGSPLNTATIMSKANSLLIQQIQNERKSFEKIQSEAVEVVFRHEQDQKKINYLELENAELRNTIQTLSSQVEDFRKLLGYVKERLDYFEIRKPPAKPRKNGKKEIPSCETPLPELSTSSELSSTSLSLPLSSLGPSLSLPETSAAQNPTTEATGLGGSSTGRNAGTKDVP